MIYILDIETKPNERLLQSYCGNIKPPANYKDQDKIDAYMESKILGARKEMSVSTDYCQIACIGIKELGKEGKIVWLHELAHLLKSESFHLVTFNGKQFDIPVIIKQGIMNDVDLPYRELIEATKKYSSRNHTDLMNELSFFGKWMSLDKYAQIYLGKEKKEIDFASASDEEIKEHCLEDLELTEELYEKFGRLF